MTPTNARVVELLRKHPVTTLQIAARLNLTAASVRNRLHVLRNERPDIVITKDEFSVPMYHIPKGGQ